MKRRNMFLSTTRVIMLGFLIVILVGSLLLSLPVSSSDGKAVPYMDALFTATTATCVTGLVTVPTFSTWSIFGQVVILCLIQIGGLGVVTIMSGLMILFHRKMGLGDRLLIQDAFNLNSMSGLVRFVKKVIVGTFIIEAVGAFLYMTVFVPQFGGKGIWISVFNSISAFCNAGMDIISENSLCDYSTNFVVNAVTAALIVFGGIGYIVWWDLIRVSKKIRSYGIKCIKLLTLHSKIALWTTTILLFFGAILFFIFEYNNPLTIGELSLFDKIQVSFFQSVTTRTAGFATVPQQYLTNASSMISLLLMFIGGSPVGTAGGIKTVTFFVLLASAFSTIRSKNEISVFNRSVSRQAVNKAVAVVAMSFIIMTVSTVLLACITERELLDIVYETVSATATVGLSRDMTAYLSGFGKIIIICTMYLGRVGPISLAIAFNIKKENRNIIKYPSEEISVG